MGIEGEMSNGVMQEALSLSIDEKEGLIDNNGGGGGGDEVMIRRMKNRERQRRYRARKRMREDAGIIDENLSFDGQELEEEEEEEMELEEYNNNGYVENFVSRVYCDRDWKKEARRVHLDGSCGPFKRKIKPHRRDWKAEARKIKT